MVEELYLVTLSRPPQLGRDGPGAGLDQEGAALNAKGVQDLLWVLLNSRSSCSIIESSATTHTEMHEKHARRSSG